MTLIHLQVLDAAADVADAEGTFAVSAVAASLPHLNAATVRTHVASRCCVNAPANHGSRYPYFRAVARGRYRIEPRFRARRRRRVLRRSWQDRLLAAVPSGVDATLIAESLKRSPTERLETMRHAAAALAAMTGR